jgi:ribonuclease HI
MDVVEGPGVAVRCFTDADYANDPADCKSVSGYVAMLDSNAISYASRKQAINAQSTAEAEYIAMSEGVKDIL